MIKFGFSLIVIASLLWVLFFLSAIFIDSTPDEGLILAAIAIGVIGGLLILIEVIKDRYNEYKEDKKNDDYRKY